MAEPKFIVERNGSVRHFHTDVEFGRQHIVSFETWSRDSFDKLVADNGQHVALMVWTLWREIPGLGTIFVSPYDVQVSMKQSSFSDSAWDERIDTIVKRAFFAAAGYPWGHPVFTVVKPPDQSVRRYNANMRISQGKVYDTFYRPLGPSDERELTEIGFAARQLVRTLFEIPGIVYVSLAPEFLRVEIGKAFTWDTIDPKVREAIKLAYGRDVVFK